MAVAEGNGELLSDLKSNCCRVAGLAGSVLQTAETVNFRDRFELGEQLGWGRFGIIRKCSDKLTGGILACKSIAKDRLVTPNDLCSVKLEIEIMRKLSGHPYVVDLKAVYEEEDYVHLVMELCAGGELFNMLEKQGRLPESQARLLFRHLMEVVLYCHDNGIIHRDLKPENVLLLTNSPSSPIKLADFGLATYIKPGQSLNGTVGSPFYIAPEVLAGGYNQAADVWSAGVILYILLSGIPPFWGKTKSEIFDAVRASDLLFPSDQWRFISSSAADLITRMLCRDPSQRLTAAQVLEHAWLNVCSLPSEDTYENGGFYGDQLDLSSISFSSSFVCRDQDFSFGSVSPVPIDTQQLDDSPLFTCKSSFSSLQVEVTPTSTTYQDFSFQSHGESDGIEFFSPIPSMPSFTFFSTDSPAEPVRQPVFTPNISKFNAIETTVAGINKMFQSPVSAGFLQQEAKDQERIKVRDARKGQVGLSATKGLAGIHSRRTQTIGCGELEQLDIVVVTESVVRWASCTILPSTLRSSLVC